MSSGLFGFFGKKDKNASQPPAPPSPKPIPPPTPASKLQPGLTPVPARTNIGAATTQPMVLPKSGGLKPAKPALISGGKSTQRIVLPGRSPEGAAAPQAMPAGNLSLPLGMIVRLLPDTVRAVSLEQFEASPEADQDVSLPIGLILPQLPSGKVEISIQELVAAVPRSYVRSPEEIAPFLSTTVQLPLMDVVMRIPPDLLALRPDQKEVDAAVVNMADPFTEELLREQAAAARKAEADKQAAAAPAAPAPTPTAPPIPVPPAALMPEGMPTVPLPRPVAGKPPVVPAPTSAAGPRPPSIALPRPPIRPSIPTVPPPAPVAATPPPPPPAPAPIETPAPVAEAGGLSEEMKKLLAAAEEQLGEGDEPAVEEKTEEPKVEEPKAEEIKVEEEKIAPPVIEPEPVVEPEPAPAPVEEPKAAVVPPPPPAPIAVPPPAPLAPPPPVAVKPPTTHVPLPIPSIPKPPTAVSTPPPPPAPPKPVAMTPPAPPVPKAVSTPPPPPAPLPKPPMMAPPVPAPIAVPPPTPMTPPTPVAEVSTPSEPAPVVAPPAPAPAPKPAAPAAKQSVDLNHCSSEQLLGSGCPKLLAEAIVKYRTANGPFRRMEDLLKVPGVTKATFALLTGREVTTADLLGTVNEVLGFPPEQEVGLKDITERICCWPDVTGCVLGQASGLPLVGKVPAGLEKSAIMAFVPRLMTELNSSFKEFSGRETSELVIPTKGVSYHIFRNENLYLVILSSRRQMPRRFTKVARYVLSTIDASRHQ